MTTPSYVCTGAGCAEDFFRKKPFIIKHNMSFCSHACFYSWSMLHMPCNRKFN